MAPRHKKTNKKIHVQLPTLHPNAAGIDIGAREIWVAVPPGSDPNPVRPFETFTDALLQLRDWLKACGVTSVAMESTGVYSIPLFQILEAAGLEVFLVNARHCKNLPGRKTDVQDCQWLQYLHSVGLLRGSFRPPETICAIRSVLRHRNRLLRCAADQVRLLHKALTQMNIQLHHVISDLTGVTCQTIRVTEIEGLTSQDIVRQFNEARAADYDELRPALNELLARNKKRLDESFVADLEKLTRQFESVRKIDFFDSPRAQDVQMLLKRAANLRSAKSKASAQLTVKKFIGRTWLTRPRPQIDRVGSAWLIRKFIDPKAKFVFAPDPKKYPSAIPYDMFEVEFSHHGDDCTFETLVKRFGIADKAALRIAEMVHDTDLEDGKFQTAECVGIDQVLKGWAKSGLSDDELLKRGGECFDALYQQLHK